MTATREPVPRTAEPPSEPPPPPAPSPLEEAVELVLGQPGGPIDAWGVAATLESVGLRDVDARTRFGREDIFALARDVYAEARRRLAASPPPAPPVAEEGPDARRGRFARFGRYYASGTFFALPMAVQIVSVVIFGYGLWAWVGFTTAQATIVALATMGSLVATGGWVQAIARLGLFYGEQGSHELARTVIRRTTLLGAAAAAVFGLLVWLANVVTGAFPLGLASAGFVYYALLCAYWLVLAVLYTLERRLAIVLTSVAGLVAIGLLREVLDASMYVSHWVGLLVASEAAWAWGRRILAERAATVTGSVKLAKLPRGELLAYAVAPYFLYGAAYYVLLFIDRLVSWGVAPGRYPITFETTYERGLDWALLLLVLTIAVLEYTIHEFSASVIPVQRRYAASQREEHNAYFERFYARQLGLLALFSIAAGLLTYHGVRALASTGDRGLQETVFSPVTVNVYFWAALGYSVLVWALLNGVFFFSLSRPGFVLRALPITLVVALAVALAGALGITYWYGSLGLAAGAVVFAAVTTVYGVRVVRSLDYYYYSAF